MPSNADKNREKSYPSWVNPKQLIIGDVKFTHVGDNQYDKHYWNGKQWLHSSVAPPFIKRKGELRGKMVRDQEMIRKGRAGR